MAIKIVQKSVKQIFFGSLKFLIFFIFFFLRNPDSFWLEILTKFRCFLTHNQFLLFSRFFHFCLNVLQTKRSPKKFVEEKTQLFFRHFKIADARHLVSRLSIG